MTIDDIKAVNDAYIANEKRKAAIERANKKADGYQAMKYIFKLMVDDRYVKRHETYIDITVMGYDHTSIFYNALAIFHYSLNMAKKTVRGSIDCLRSYFFTIE